jgi:hypothetical protein
MPKTSEIEDLADEAKRTGRAETLWGGLRIFFGGTPEEAWQNMVKSFQELGVRATTEDRTMNRKKVTVVVLVPLANGQSIQKSDPA